MAAINWKQKSIETQRKNAELEGKLQDLKEIADDLRMKRDRLKERFASHDAKIQQVINRFDPKNAETAPRTIEQLEKMMESAVTSAHDAVANELRAWLPYPIVSEVISVDPGIPVEQGGPRREFGMDQARKAISLIVNRHNELAETVRFKSTECEHKATEIDNLNAMLSYYANMSATQEQLLRQILNGPPVQQLHPDQIPF